MQSVALMFRRQHKSWYNNKGLDVSSGPAVFAVTEQKRGVTFYLFPQLSRRYQPNIESAAEEVECAPGIKQGANFIIVICKYIKEYD